MAQPTKGDVHVNRPLTNISIAYLQDARDFVADQVFPNIPVLKQSDAYWTYDRSFFNRDEMKIRAPGTESAGSGYEVDPDNTYYAPVRAYHHDIPDQVRANADDQINPDRDATNLITHKALIHRETQWASKYFVTSIWSLDRTGVSSSPTGDQFLQWNDALSTPIEDIRNARRNVKENTGFKPNTLVLGMAVIDALYDHPDIVDRIKYGQTPNGPADVSVADLQNLFKIPRIFVSEAIQNTAAEGATEANAFIMGKAALLCYSAPVPGLMTPTAGYTFSWTGFLGAAPQGMRIKRFRMDKLESDRVEIDMAFDQKLIAADLGEFFATAVA